MPSWAPVVSAAVAVFLFLFGLFKWYSSVENEREELKIKSSKDRHLELVKILEEHKNEFKRINSNIESVERDLMKTRDELHKDYAKIDQVNSHRLEMKDDFDKVFKRLSSISENLNQLIGKINNG